jgi:hypothetical protein
LRAEQDWRRERSAEQSPHGGIEIKIDSSQNALFLPLTLQRHFAKIQQRC